MDLMLSCRVHRLPSESLAAAFHADVEAYSAWASGQNRIGGPPPTGLPTGKRSFNNPKPIRANTLVDHQSTIYLAASALVRSGVDASTITSIEAAASPESLLLLLEEIAKYGTLRAEICNSSYQTRNLYSLVTAQRLRSIALNWCEGLLHREPEYKKIIALVRPQQNIQEGMSRKNSDRLRQFSDSGVLEKWFHLPDILMQRAERQRIQSKTVSPRVIADMQTAVALALLQMLPMRGSNLAHLRIGWDPNIIFSRQEAILYIRAEQVKNRRDLSAKLSGRVLSLLMLYVTRYLEKIRRRTGSHADNPFLFPGVGMQNKALNNISENIKARAREICGIQLNLHLLRHLAAKIIVGRAPRELNAVSGFLGHASVETTQRFYLSPDKSAAKHRYRTLICPPTSAESDKLGNDGKELERRAETRIIARLVEQKVAATPRLLEIASSFGYIARRDSATRKSCIIARLELRANKIVNALRLFSTLDNHHFRHCADEGSRISKAVDHFIKLRRQQCSDLTLLGNLEDLSCAFRSLGLKEETEYLRKRGRLVRHATCFPGTGRRPDPSAWRTFGGWPARAKEAWLRMSGPSAAAGATFIELGRRPRWASSTEKKVHRVYSRFLNLMRIAEMPPRITPDSVQKFIDHFVAKNAAAGSLFSVVRDLYAAASVIAADEDMTWLRHEVNRLKHLADRAPSRRVVPKIDPVDIWTAGRSLIAKARSTGEADYKSSLLFRDGLILSMAIAVPIRSSRLRRFVLLQDEIFFEPAASEGDLVRVDLQHWPELATDVRDFGSRYRVLFLPNEQEHSLWLSASGNPLSRRQLVHIFRSRSTQLLGSPISLDALRRSIMDLFLFDAPEHVDDVAIILGYLGTSVVDRLRARANQLINQEKAVGILGAAMRSLAADRPALT